MNTVILIEPDHRMVALQQPPCNDYFDPSMTVGAYEKLLVQFEQLVDAALAGNIDGVS